jgi:DNA-binding transcriptional ArsR family regulator
MLDEVTERVVREFLSITKALSDESRLRALLTVKDGELCLCQIIEVLGLSPSTVSKHMNVLQQAGLVRRRKEGKWHFYRLADGEASRVARGALSWALDELKADPRVREDSRRIRDVRSRALEELSACYRS